MLVYANHLRVRGADAEGALFKAVGGWLKEQLGFGLHPDQLKQDGEYNGHRGKQRSRLRIHGCYSGEPALCAWVLKHADEDVHGRQWIVEVGVKKFAGTFEVSCVVKTDERSTLVSSPVSASQPRVIQYVTNNVLSRKDADFVDAVPGEFLRTIGQDRDSYRAFLAEIERADRDGAIVLVSATREGEYLVNPTKLQRTLIGLAHVVQVLPGSDSYEMAEILGQPWSAWNGAVNVMAIPSRAGMRSRYFLHDAIRSWGDEPQRVSQILAWVTASTNIPRLRMHVRPEGVMQLSMRRRSERVRATSAQMTAAQLRQALDEASTRVAEQERFLNEIVEENAGLEAELSRYKDDLEETRDKLRTESFQLKSLRDRFTSVGDGSGTAFSPEVLLEVVLKEQLSPLDCLELIEQVYANRCTVLDSARSSARKMTRFIHGRDLLDLLRRLVTTYRDELAAGGDTKARGVFGKSEYAAKESETVMDNKVMRRQRTFEYDGTPVEMFRHLKIGVEDDPTRTIRVHFHWDGDREKIVIGYCGEHLAVSRR